MSLALSEAATSWHNLGLLRHERLSENRHVLRLAIPGDAQTCRTGCWASVLPVAGLWAVVAEALIWRVQEATTSCCGWGKTP